MDSLMRIKTITFAIGIAAVVFVTPSAVQSQDFLKQLEARLKQGLTPVKPTPPEGSEEPTPIEEPSETPPKPDPEPSEAFPAEDSLPAPSGSLPMPNGPAKTETGGDVAPLQLSPPKGRSKAPLVITPKNKARTDAFAPPKPMLNSESVQGPGITTPGDILTPGDEGVFLGLTLEPVLGGGFGLAVVEVAIQSPAWKGGFREGDRVIGIEGQAVSSIDQFASELTRFPVGAPVKFLVQRRGRSLNLVAVLQDRGLAAQLQGIPDTNPSRSMPPTPYQPISEALMGEDGAVLGVSVSDLSDPFRLQFGIPVYRGASISEVVVGSPAEVSGLRPGDCIVDIDGRMINFAEEVVGATRSALPGQTMRIGFYRGQKKMLVDVLLWTSDPSVRGSESGYGSPTQSASPEYVAQLQDEVIRLREELTSMQNRIQELEGRLQRSRR